MTLTSFCVSGLGTVRTQLKYRFPSSPYLVLSLSIICIKVQGHSLHKTKHTRSRDTYYIQSFTPHSIAKGKNKYLIMVSRTSTSSLWTLPTLLLLSTLSIAQSTVTTTITALPFSDFPLLPSLSEPVVTPLSTPLYVSVPYTTTATAAPLISAISINPGGAIQNLSTTEITSTTVIGTSTKTFTTLPAYINGTGAATSTGASVTGSGLPFTGGAMHGSRKDGMSVLGLVVAIMGLIIAV